MRSRSASTSLVDRWLVAWLVGSSLLVAAVQRCRHGTYSCSAGPPSIEHVHLALDVAMLEKRLQRCDPAVLRGLLLLDDRDTDPWGTGLVVVCGPDDTFAVISAGPDQLWRTDDDLVAGPVASAWWPHHVLR